MTKCINCNHTATENFCSNCGQPTLVKRIDSHYILHELQHILHFEKGIFYTIKVLLTTPGKSIQEFISINRNRLVKPILFIIVTSLIYSITDHFFHVEESYVVTSNNETEKKLATVTIFTWIQNHYGYANIIVGIFIAFWLKLFFKKYDYNFFEIVILLCFVIGVGMLLFSVFAIVEGLTKIRLMQLACIVFFVYASWAIGQFFDRKKVIAYLKAFSAYIVGMITFYLSALLLGFLFDQVIKH